MSKNKLKIAIIIITTILLVFCMSSCDTDDIEIIGDEIKDYVSTNQYFDIENLLYNSNYQGEEDEKGFLLYDELNFNKIAISNEVQRRDCYEVEYVLSIEREKLEFEEVYRTTDNTIPYIFIEAGHYKLDVEGTVKKQVSDVFYFNVANQKNLPDEIKFEIYQNDEKIDSAKAGEAFTIKAILYLNGEVIEEDKGYKTYWNDNDEGDRNLLTEVLPNSVVDTEKEYQFLIKNKKNTNYESETAFTYTLPIKENLDKVEVTYDWDTTTICDIDIRKENSFDIKDKIIAKYIFDNADIEEIDISYDIPIVGDAVVLIKYEGEEDYKTYYSWDIDVNGHREVVNTNDYNFNLDKVGVADIKVAICQNRTSDIYNYFEYDDVENSDIGINIVATELSTFDVVSYSGKYRKFSTSPLAGDSFVDYEDVSENTIIELNEEKTLDCIINTQRLNSQKEYLMFNVNINADASCPEYYFDANTDDFTILYSRDDDDKLIVKVFPMKSGTLSFDVKSVFVEDKVQTITCNVDNPLAGYEISPIRSNMVILWIDGIGNLEDFNAKMKENVIIKNYYYNEFVKERDEHTIDLDNEEVSYYYEKPLGILGEIELTNLKFGSLNYDENQYNIDVRMQNNENGLKAKMSDTLSVWVVPNFDITIDGTTKSMIEWTTDYYSYEEKLGDTKIYEVDNITKVKTENGIKPTVVIDSYDGLTEDEQERFLINETKNEDKEEIVLVMQIKSVSGANSQTLVINGFIIDYHLYT
ncbi:MAG: hypothetical protein WCR54_04880 [Clostridia bacterium]